MSPITYYIWGESRDKMKICFDLICYNEVYEEVELEKGYLIGHGQSYVRKINFESNEGITVDNPF